MKVVVNLTWRCVFQCPYCWVRALGWWGKSEGEHTWQEWAEALAKHLPKNSYVDFSGGEPLVFEGLHSLISALISNRPDIRWAMTTNLAPNAWTEFVDKKLLNCFVINVSVHPQTGREVKNRLMLLSQKYPTTINRVDHPAAPQVLGIHYNLISYEDWVTEPAIDGKPRYCDAGTRHVVMIPNGDIYRCSVEPRVGVAPSGNLFREEFLEGGERLCTVGCSTCYTDLPIAWQVQMRLAEDKQPTL